MNPSTRALVALITLPLLAACGRAPSSLLRKGQLPVYDFPLYLTERSAGNVWKFDRDANKSLLASGLNQPQGIATDRYNNVYVTEIGTGRLLRIDAESGNQTVVAEGLGSPSAVAVDDFGEPFVIQEDDNSIIRANDGKVFARYDSLPTGLVFGVGGRMIVSLAGAGRVDWISNPEPLAGGATSAEFLASVDRVSATSLQDPTNVSIDGMGRVYVSENALANARILRFDQDGPNHKTVIADDLVAPNSAVSDPVGNIFMVIQIPGAIDVATFDGTSIVVGWAKTLNDPQGLAFTQY